MALPGHDKRAPPKHPSEGRACHIHHLTFDHPFPFDGPKKVTPPFARFATQIRHMLHPRPEFSPNGDFDRGELRTKLRLHERVSEICHRQQPLSCVLPLA